MYYLMNWISIFFITITIALIYTKEVSSTVVLVFLIIAAAAKIFASAYAMSKYDELEDRIKKLENKKENENEH